MGAVKCLACGKILISKDRHDYKTCGCPQNTMVDGGDEYLRMGGKEMAKVQVLHPVMLIPVNRANTSEAAGPVEGTTTTDTSILLGLVNGIQSVLTVFPTDFDLAEARRDSPFKDELLEEVIRLRRQLHTLRDSILTNNEAKAAPRSRKASKKKK
jgi:hypothetical protein